MKSAKALFLDLDGTLLDGSGGHEAIVRTCAQIAATQPGLEAARLLQANSAVWREYWPQVENGWTLGVLDGEAISLEAWRRALRACGYGDDSLARFARETHRQQLSETLRLFDDAQELLTSLSHTSLPLALITNGASDTQREALRLLGIEHRFHAIIISGEVGVAKPNVSIFDIAINRLGVEPESVWHVGDNLNTDVAGAKAAGLTAVWLNRGGVRRQEGDPTPDHEIRSLLELPALLSE